MQGILSIFTIFVNYADFYVNIIMSTEETKYTMRFTIFDYLSTYRAGAKTAALHVDFARIPSKICRQVNLIYLPLIFVQLNDRQEFYIRFPSFFLATLAVNSVLRRG